MDHLVELEFDAENNGSYHFRPAQRSLRGRFDAVRLPDAGKVRTRFPRPIPGQRLGFNFATNECYIREPLYDAEHAAVRKELEKNWRLEPERQLLPVDAATFVYWTQEAMKAGKLRPVMGQFPTKVAGEPTKRFRFVEEPSEVAQLTSEFRRLADLLERALSKK